jgi:hypothetical protein
MTSPATSSMSATTSWMTVRTIRFLKRASVVGALHTARKSPASVVKHCVETSSERGGTIMTAVGIGRYYLYPLAVAGQPGVERALGLLRTAIERDMMLMGCSSIDQLSRRNLRIR